MTQRRPQPPPSTSISEEPEEEVHHLIRKEHKRTRERERERDGRKFFGVIDDGPKLDYLPIHPATWSRITPGHSIILALTRAGRWVASSEAQIKQELHSAYVFIYVK